MINYDKLRTMCWLPGLHALGKGQMGSALMAIIIIITSSSSSSSRTGSLQISCFLTEAFWVLPFTYFYPPRSLAILQTIYNWGWLNYRGGSIPLYH